MGLEQLLRELMQELAALNANIVNLSADVKALTLAISNPVTKIGAEFGPVKDRP
jgi:hypothetical protein